MRGDGPHGGVQGGQACQQTGGVLVLPDFYSFLEERKAVNLHREAGRWTGKSQLPQDVESLPLFWTSHPGVGHHQVLQLCQPLALILGLIHRHFLLTRQSFCHLVMLWYLDDDISLLNCGLWFRDVFSTLIITTDIAFFNLHIIIT